MRSCFSLASFKVLSLSFNILIMCLRVIFGLILLRDFWANCSWISITLPRCGKFSAILYYYFLNYYFIKLSSPFSLFPVTPMRRIFICLVVSHNSHRLSISFILFCFVSVTGSFQMLCVCVLWFLWQIMIKCVVEPPCWIFQFCHCMLWLQDFFFIFSIASISLLTL